MAERTTLIAGNWKMNASGEMAVTLIDGLVAWPGKDGVEMLVCPPFPYLGPVGALISESDIKLGAQTCHANASGAHTGDVAAEMLADLGCSYVIVGHSERRADHGETDADVCAKAEAALRAGLTAIVCVGETEAERDAGKTLDIVGSQVANSVPEGATAENLVVAYEPVWAIGTGRTPTSDEVQEVHAAIRAGLASRFGDATANGVRLLYGGSMKPSNAQELLALADVDGGLIGGASLKAEDFTAIADAAP
ncbi:MAG: triose-phosphate isomerase [Rhodospirillales bacterium]|nr:triose-phosphate isomerase [Rhodospirillales bacterium]MBO6786760.1 triose-phosphate isomerase [Rhodospirillales bacterium]